MRELIFTGIGMAGSAAAALLGGWDMALFFVLIAARLDLLLHTDYLRNVVCIGFIANEAVSILENAGLMGLPLPECIVEGIDLLKKKESVVRE